MISASPRPESSAGSRAAAHAPLVIAVLTYKRTADLAVALPRLLHQARTAPIPAQVLVIDNDPDAGARDVVEGRKDPALIYVHEPRPGIAAARNRALKDAGTSSRLLAFIDDDEVPSEHWLQQLAELQKRTGAAAVVGPVLSEYAVAPDPWIAAGEFFKRRRLETGSRITVAATNNLLLDLGQIRDLGLEFDERFGLSGGSDTLFTRQLVQAGAVMLWCDEAVVVDRVPESRLTRAWVLRRAFRSGNCHSRVRLTMMSGRGPKFLARLQLVAPGAARLGGGAAQALTGIVTGSLRLKAKGLRTAARGAGILTGAVGYVFSEYKRSGHRHVFRA
ncbi:glycosyltransferase family A protein [Arthrobacter sp. ATA002]|uniref:glycosyltransferase family 2 protein n=1 Tax=Arthrobacter sp. ATA002 TaxID=2991715 RepID=UPI0022A7FE40|nr:glycosyltransferase family A protein [Arthrobacter sp. ATA002]WAP51160.1 glycosyltransferase family A protein [Arthrobacter sp. ATA002]